MRFLLGFCSMIITLQAHSVGIPVYLKLESLYPSGHYKREWLSERTKQIATQRWFRVSMPDKTLGWISEDHVITPLKLSTHAEIVETTPSRKSPHLDNLDNYMLKKGTVVKIKQWSGSWVKIIDKNREAWVPSSSLNVAPAILPKYVIAREAAIGCSMPLPKCKGKLFDAEELLLVHGKQPGWFKIYNSEKTYFVRETDVLSPKSFVNKSLIPKFHQAPIRSAPIPNANVITHARSLIALNIIEEYQLRWGMVQIPDIGKSYWPIDDDLFDPNASASDGDMSSQDILSRDIYDVAQHSSPPAISLVSADGVFRSFDGENWKSIRQFDKQNHHLAISEDGTIFVGEYMSRDRGENFQSWIRWDKLLDTLKRTYRLTTASVKIINIVPIDFFAQQIALEIQVGSNKITVKTLDQGQTWRAIAKR